MIRLNYHITGGDFSNAGTVASQLKKALKQLFGDHTIVRRSVVAMYEAEVNVVAHAYSGSVSIEITDEYIKINVDDSGPGIPDIQLAMKEGYSTASEKVREMGFGAGMGLSNIKNNTDSFTIKSQPGTGTNLQIVSYINSNRS